MSYIFFGTPEFAAIILRLLVKAGIPPKTVITNPDRPQGRKKIVTSPPAKVVASEVGIEVLQPEKIDDDFLKELKQRNANFFVVAAYAKILPRILIELPPLGVIGVHPSLLPAFRGSTPIQSAILAGEKNSGTTLFMIDEKVDHGSIIAQEETEIGDMSYDTLMKHLAEISGALLVKTLPLFATGKVISRMQNEAHATFTKKLSTEDGFVPFDELQEACAGTHPDLAKKLLNKIRALNPEPGVWTVDAQKIRTKILAARIIGDALRLTTIQKEGRRPEAAS